MTLIPTMIDGIPVDAVVFHTDEWANTVIQHLGFVPIPGPEWSVWNAPRPLAGSHAWHGPYRHGVHYAAIRRDDDEHDSTQRENTRLDASPIALVTDRQILDAVTAYAARHGHTLAGCVDLGIDPADLAEELGLPWRTSTTHQANIASLGRHR